VGYDAVALVATPNRLRRKITPPVIAAAAVTMTETL
jgi:hypothetical protein